MHIPGMTKISLLLTATTLLMASSSSVVLSDHPAKPDLPRLEVWTIDYISPEITRSKLKPMVDYFEQQTPATYYLNASNDFEAIQERCPSGKPELLVASTPLLELVTENCDYEMLALAENTVHLIVHTERVDVENPDIKSVGLLSHTQGSVVAEKEYLAAQGGRVQPVYYRSFLDMIFKDQEQQLDAVIMPYGFFKKARRFEKDWVPIRTFEGRGNTAIMASKTVAPEIKEKIRDLLLSNNPDIVEYWNRTLGLGGFIAPSADSQANKPSQ